MVDSIRLPGGAETLAMEGAMRLDPGRFETTLCVTRWEEAFGAEEPARSWLRRLGEANVRVVGLKRNSPYEIWAWLPLVRLLRRERIQVLHAHLFGSNFWASILGRLAGVPVVVAHEHMWSYSGSRGRQLIDRWIIAPLSTAFVAVSEFGRRQMIETEGIPKEDIVYLQNGAPSLGRGDGDDLRGHLGLEDGRAVVGSVGHLRTEKAFEVLIQAVELLGRDGLSPHVVIVGEGPERSRLEALISDLGVDGRVQLLGARTDVADVLDLMDIAVCCSDFEGGPLSVMEYMEAGLPVVASRVGGLPEMVEDGINGLLVAPRDPEALARGLARLLTDPDEAARMGMASRECWLRSYDINVWVGRIEQLYEDLLASRKPGRQLS